MKLKVFLISAIALVSSGKTFAACYGSSTVGSQALQVAHYAYQLADTLGRINASPYLLEQTYQVGDLAQNLNANANEYAFDCRLARDNFNSVNSAYHNLSEQMRFVGDRYARNDFADLTMEFNILRDLAAQLQSSHPRRVIVHPYPGRRVIVPRIPPRRVVVRPHPGRRVGPPMPPPGRRVGPPMPPPGRRVPGPVGPGRRGPRH